MLQTLSLFYFTFQYCTIIFCRWCLFSRRVRCAKPNSIPPYFFSSHVNSSNQQPEGKKEWVRLIDTAFLIKATENQLFIWNISYGNLVIMKVPVGIPRIPHETFFAFGDFEKERKPKGNISTLSIVTETVWRPPPLFRRNTATALYFSTASIHLDLSYYMPRMLMHIFWCEMP